MNLHVGFQKLVSPQKGLSGVEIGAEVLVTAFSANSKLFASGSGDGKVRVYRIGDGSDPTLTYTLGDATDRVLSLAFSADSKLFQGFTDGGFPMGSEPV